jgi:hypothetical protein
MSAGVSATEVTIGAIHLGRTAGIGIMNWSTYYPSTNVVELNLAKAFESGNRPDVIADFSSRGPGVGNVLKPDIAAPGVNILAQGYTPYASGEARHLGFGTASGTSMASPHVAGAAVLLRQIHPEWSNEQIKSALMTTSKYVGIYVSSGAHAQPLDMGAGRLDLTNAADPGVLLSPVNASFGQVLTNTISTRNVWVTNITGASETYNVSLAKFTATAFGTPSLVALPGFSVAPSSITLPAGGTAVLTVTFDANGIAPGDNQGYVVLDGSTHDAHFPVWARTIGATAKPVLLIDKDSNLTGDVSFYYSSALGVLGHAYDKVTTVPTAAVMAKYKYVILYTADEYRTAAFTAPQDFNRLVEYMNQGGKVVVMGQDFASASGGNTTNPPFFYSAGLGAEYLQDSVTAEDLPDLPVTTRTGAPEAFAGINLDLSGLKWNTVSINGANEVPPVATTLSGVGKFAYDAASNYLYYDITIHNPGGAGSPVTITAGHIHTGTVGTNGAALYTITASKTITTPDLHLSDGTFITDPEEVALLANGLYVNFHTAANPAGEIRGQINAALVGDGWWNQAYIDELKSFFGSTPEPDPGVVDGYVPFLTYNGTNNVADGTVGVLHRDQPSLERPGVSYIGGSVFTTFGLEGVNDGLVGYTERAELLGTFFDYLDDVPEVSIANVSLPGGDQSQFQATLTSNIAGIEGVQYRWDFGDGSPYTLFYTSDTVGHTYEYCGLYTVRVEAVDSFGNHTIGTFTNYVTKCTTGVARWFIPMIMK